MEKLRELSFNRIESIDTSFVRFLYDEIDWKDRLIGIRGARGTGKTTLILQYIQQKGIKELSLYVSLDTLFFQSVPLTQVADYYYKQGIRHLFLDEVHKYPTWSAEIKSLYDHYPDLQLVFTGSSVVELFKGQADISRRVAYYDLPGLSFREFLMLERQPEIPVYSLDELLAGHVALSREIREAIGVPLKHFKKYMEVGYYPYYLENEKNYHQRLLNTVNLILETDLTAVENITYASVRKLKALLYSIARSVPFKPNISSLGEKIESKRDTVLQYLDFLQRAMLLKLLRSSKSGMVQLNKPEKIYLDNTNLIVALAEGSPDIGNMRETFFLNQVIQKHRVSFPPSGDFEIDRKIIVEVGGQHKTSRQLKTSVHGYIAADDIETGTSNKIPLWLFGFLY